MPPRARARLGSVIDRPQSRQKARRMPAHPEAIVPPAPEPPDADPGPALAQRVISAGSEADWAGLESLWPEYVEHHFPDPLGDALAVFADLPDEARRRFPLLSWARAVALGRLAAADDRQRVVTAAVLRDAVTLHFDWQQHTDVDAAVRAGTMWLAGQQFQTDGRRGSDAVWATRNAIAGHIEDRRLAGQTPSDSTAAAFHTKSAQLALMRADIEKSIAEADRAIMLQQAGRSGRIALAVRRIALELQGTLELASPGEEPGTDRPEPPDVLGLVSLPTWLAEAAEGIRTLDRDATWRALDHLSAVEGEPFWPIRVVLTAATRAIWEDPEEALLELDRDLARNALTSLEHHEPISQVYLARVRALLLCHLSDPAAALEQLKDVPHPWDWAPRARVALWAGDLDGAIRTAREGLFVDPGTWQADRLQLSVVIAAALACLPGADPQEQQREFWRAIRACTRAQSVTGLAQLPSFALTGLLKLHDQLCSDGCILCHPVTRQRMAELSGAGRGSETLIRLTPREKDLLPLLASRLSVPLIARHLHLSVGTVRKQVATLRSKFGAHTREELVRLASAAGHLGARRDRRPPTG